MKKIKAVEIVLFVCLVGSCFIVPRFVTSQLLSGLTTHTHISFLADLDEAYPPGAEEKAKIEAKKARDFQIGPLIDAETLLKDAQYEKDTCRSAAGKAAAQRKIDELQVHYDVENAKMQALKEDLIRPWNPDPRPVSSPIISPVFPEGGWFEQVIRVGLIGLTVFYALRVAKRIDRKSLPAGEDKGGQT